MLCGVLIAAPATAQRTSSTASPAKVLTAAQLRALDSHIEQVRQQWSIPGLSIAIVQGDSVVFAKGYGVKEVGKTDPVDDRTLFSIGSSGKSMTAAATAMLVDEGKMRFDAPVWTYLPDFRVEDPFVSRYATIRDLLAHRTGVENSTGAWYGSPLSRAQPITQRFRYLKQSFDFRSRLLYNNLMLMAAGEAAAATAGLSFEDLLDQRLFKPLEMRSTVVSVVQVPPGSNIVTPHRVIDGAPVPIPHRNTQNIGGAGGYYSSAEMRTVSIPARTPVVLSDSGTTSLGYGLGWFLEYYRGYRSIDHGGAIDGMLAAMTVLPEAGIGVVVLTNRDGHAMHTALVQRIFDIALGLPERDWNGMALARMTRAQNAQGEQAAAPTGAPPSLPVAEYAGTYADSLNGPVRVTFEAGTLRLAWDNRPGFSARLTPFRFNTFRIVDWESAGVLAPLASLATFQLDPSGKPSSLEINNLGSFGVVRERGGRSGPAGN